MVFSLGLGGGGWRCGVGRFFRACVFVLVSEVCGGRFDKLDPLSVRPPLTVSFALITPRCP